MGWFDDSKISAKLPSVPLADCNQTPTRHRLPNRFRAARHHGLMSTQILTRVIVPPCFNTDPPCAD